MVEWIEIAYISERQKQIDVSTLVVEWIEMYIL